MKSIKRLIYFLILIPICFEVALLILGYRKYEPIDYSISSKPTYCLSPDSKFGFGLAPGSFDVTMNKGLTYSVSHTKDSLRIIPFQSNDTSTKIYFFGCSYTYGMGVNDNETFPALVQKELPNSQVKNFGVPGFGTIQSYLQLKKLIDKNDIPSMVVLNYADFHDMRNALTPFYRENLKIGFENSSKQVKRIMTSSRIPYLQKKAGKFLISYCHWNQLYKNWSLRDIFASVNFLQSKYDLNTDHSIHKKEITFHLVDKINKLCKKNNIKFLITGITKTEDTELTLIEFEKNGVQTLDISVDLSLKKYNNMPFDSHPNKLTHSIWAKKIITFFSQTQLAKL